ncbi:hypothetical protein VTL71DRAFT_3838 [Oculimacula yallundae]|uniref:Cell wall anchored protein n=1 Tax=Oculimacula yallundae TaxID=86028 RepID=A0ABR4C467_9HELO
MKISVLLGFSCVTGAVASVFERQTASSGSGTSSASGTLPTPSLPQNINGSKYDISQHFCRIWRHASVLANGKIYIDGGNTFTPTYNTTFSNTPQANIENGMNDNLIVIDLSKDFNNQDTAPYSVIHKGPQVPNGLIEQTLWYSQITRKIYQLGGWFSFNSQTDPGFTELAKIPPSAIWEFDIDTQLWKQSAFNYVSTGSKVERSGAAANCDVPSLNMSFLFEGYVQQRSDAEYTTYERSSTFKFIEGMLQLDTNTSPPTLTNISVPTYIGPRMNGAMIHVPVGKKGVLVQIAGQVPQDPTPFGTPILKANEKNVNIDNGFVDIYDIETGFWFRQQTFGGPDIPSGRSDICTVLVAAPDGSSFNIFVIAGIMDYNNVVAHEDMWILTIPTFQWVQVHTRPGGVFGHTCHAVGENLIVVGGMQTDEKGGAVKNCSSHMPAEIFSLVDLEYTGKFDFAGASRTPPVPAQVVKLIGGTSTGGASAPNLVWSDAYLQYVFKPSLPRPSYKPTYTLAAGTLPTNTTSPIPTSAPSPKKNNIGLIAGASVGGFVLLAILLTLFIILYRRRNAKRRAAVLAAADPHHPEPNELPSYQDAKYNDPHAVEVSAYQEPLQFAPYRMQSNREPAEMDAHGSEMAEERDQWRPLSPEIGVGLGLGSSPRMRTERTGSPRFSEVSRDSGTVSPSLIEGEGTPKSPNSARLSRQSEVSRE